MDLAPVAEVVQDLSVFRQLSQKRSKIMAPFPSALRISLMLFASWICCGCSSVPMAGRSLESLVSKPLEGRLAAARLLERRKEYEKAEAAYDAILREEPECAIAWHRQGVVHAKRGKLAEAEKNFDRALMLGPFTAELANDRGYILFLQDRLSEAEIEFRKAVEHTPDFKPAWTNLGLVLGQSGQFEEAFKACQQSAASPAEAHCSLAYIYAQCFELEKAQAEYQQALTLDPELQLAAEGLLQVSAMLPGSQPRTIVSTSASTRSQSQEDISADALTGQPVEPPVLRIASPGSQQESMRAQENFASPEQAFRNADQDNLIQIGPNYSPPR